MPKSAQAMSLRTLAVGSLNATLTSGLLPLDIARGLGLHALKGIGPLRRAVMREGLQPGNVTPSLMRAAQPE